MDFLNATDPATLTASPQRVFKSRCYFCSSTNSCADHLPTAASTAVRTLNIAQTADSKPPTTAPTTPSRTSSICSPLRDGATSLLESSCLTSRRLESKMPPCPPEIAPEFLIVPLFSSNPKSVPVNDAPDRIL